MNSSILVLLGAFDALIALIESEREALGKSFDLEAAVQTLRKVKSEFTSQFLAFDRAQLHASDTFRTTVDQLLTALPSGSDLESVVRSLKLSVLTYLPQGPTPPWPSSSSSSSPLGLDLHSAISQLTASLQHLTGPKL
jgi:hypothetical protein